MLYEPNGLDAAGRLLIVASFLISGPAQRLASRLSLTSNAAIVGGLLLLLQNVR